MISLVKMNNTYLTLNISLQKYLLIFNEGLRNFSYRLFMPCSIIIKKFKILDNAIHEVLAVKDENTFIETYFG